MGPSLVGISDLEDFDLKNKKVFLRLDLNVPMAHGDVQDDTRILAVLPTIRFCLEHGAKLIVASHLGRPQLDSGDSDKNKFSLAAVGARLSELLQCEVIFIEDFASDALKVLLPGLKPDQFVLLENLRFHRDETQNQKGLCKTLAPFIDVYINDAFGVSHRQHASIVSLPDFASEKGVGLLMRKELNVLSKLLGDPPRPYYAILGGAKISDKIDLIENLIPKVDGFVIGGAMAYTFLAAQGVDVGESLVQRDKMNYTRELLERLESKEKKIFLPVDHRVVRVSDNSPEKLFEQPRDQVAPLRETVDNSIEAGWVGVDIGPQTEKVFAQALAEVKTVFWNGPMGVFENKKFASGTFAVAQALSELTPDSFVVVGGGDSAAAVMASGLSEKMSHVSTGGGATLEYLRGELLPGLKVLKVRE